jgi:hypothetical protein
MICVLAHTKIGRSGNFVTHFLAMMIQLTPETNWPKALVTGLIVECRRIADNKKFTCNRRLPGVTES